mgnify:CR=1 FL=1
MPPKANQDTAIYVPEINPGEITINVLGMSPIIMNRLSEKAKRELLMPKGRKTAADKAQNLKHDPIAEFKASPYVLPAGSPAYLGVMSSAFKKAMMTAALDLPGTNKRQIGRLLYVAGEFTAIYGVPKLLTSVTRSADMNRTPDIRTRAIVPQWAARVTVHFITSTLNPQSITNLMTAAGMTSGVGDWRPEKGSGSYGTFTVVPEGFDAFDEIVANGGYDAQYEAMQAPEYYNDETAELLEWYAEEIVKRGKAA